MAYIFINGRFFSQPITGAQRYGYELLRELDSLPSSPDITMILLVPPSTQGIPEFSKIVVKSVGIFSGQLWEQLELPFYSRKGLLFTPCGGAPLLHLRNVITIHDAAVVAFPKGYSWIFRTWYRILNWSLCHSAAHILTVSHFAKRELIQWYGAKPDDVSVTYLGSEHVFNVKSDTDILQRYNLKPHNYIFSVGSNNPNKNFSGLVEALKFITNESVQIAVAGPRDIKIFGANRLSHRKVCDLGYVSDSELRALYENAACFVFPSFYEGFGLPPLESLALGCPVVVSDAAAMGEVFQSIGAMCDPADPADIGAQINKVLASNNNANSLIAFSKRFSWHTCATETWSVFVKCLDQT